MNKYKSGYCKGIFNTFLQSHAEKTTQEYYTIQSRKNKWPGYRAMLHAHNFKNWNELLTLYGVKQNNYRMDHMTDKQLLEQFKDEFLRIAPKTLADFNSKTNFCKIEVYEKRFNLTYSYIVKMIGENSSHNFYTQDELKTLYFEIWDKTGEQPSVSVLKIYGFPMNAIHHNLNGFLKKIGVVEKRKTPDVVKESDEELIDIYVNFSKKIGADNGASFFDLRNSDKIYDAGVFIIRFGSMNDLRKKCGYIAIRSGTKKQYTKKEIAEMLLGEYKKEYRKLTNKEIQISNELPAVSTICNYFHTAKMSEVWKEVLEQLVK